MGHRYAVIGAGRQGVATAYDLVHFGEASQVLLLDQDGDRAEEAAHRVNRLTDREYVQSGALDVRDRAALVRALTGCDAALSAVPYRLNVEISRAAVEVGAHLCDLGGSTESVLRQLKLDSEARRAGVTVVPDCGLAPGTANVLASFAVHRLEALGARASAVRIYCGGLPQRPRPPLNYRLLFSIEGLLKEYTAPAHVLRDGRPIRLEPLTELETVEFQEPVGRLEAFLTSGGASTGPWTYRGKLLSYEYKTLRYPGHCAILRAIRDLGLLEEVPLAVRGTEISPRELFQLAAAPRLDPPDEPDLVVLRVIGRGTRAEGRIELQLDLMDFYDEGTGFTAMERTTGFSAAIVMALLARGQLEPGVATPERAVPPERYLRALLARGFRVRETRSGPLDLG